MQELQNLLAASANGGGGRRSLVASLERGIVLVVIFGVFAFACAFAVVGALAAAVFFAALPDYGEIKAACLTALAAAVLMGVLALSLRWLLQPEPQQQQAPQRASPLAGAAHATPPKTVWDLVTLVIAGVVAGLAQKR